MAKKKKHHGAPKKKKKNKENKRENRRGTAMDITIEPKSVRPSGTQKKKHAPLVFARPKGPKGTRQTTAVTEVKGDNMKRLQAINKAHKGSISEIACANGEVYTCGHDGMLRTWVTKKDLGPICLEQKLAQDVGSPAWSLLVTDGAIFCGLQTGSIKVFSPTGSSASLEGHTSRVTAILVHQGVIISGSFDSTVKLWKMENDAFRCIQTVQMSAQVRSMLVTKSENNIALWVGTSDGLFGLDLLNLQNPPVRVVKNCTTAATCLLEYADHVLAGFRDGSLKCFDKNGALKHEMTPYPDCNSLASFTVVCEGNRLICGFNNGRMASFSLPTFERRARWDTFDRVKTSSVRSCGSDGYYMVASEAGELQLWQHDDTDDL